MESHQPSAIDENDIYIDCKFYALYLRFAQVERTLLLGWHSSFGQAGARISSDQCLDKTLTTTTCSDRQRRVRAGPVLGDKRLALGVIGDIRKTSLVFDDVATPCPMVSAETCHDTDSTITFVLLQNTKLLWILG